MSQPLLYDMFDDLVGLLILFLGGLILTEIYTLMSKIIDDCTLLYSGYTLHR